MSFEVEGKLHKVFEMESKTSSFQAREFVLEVMSGSYPQFVKFQLVQDRCALLDNHKEGQTIKVFFDLRGREWQGKYFTNLNAWKIESAGASVPVGQSVDFGESAGFPASSDEPSFPQDDDLPF